MTTKKLKALLIVLGIILSTYFISAQTNQNETIKEKHMTYLGLKIPSELLGHPAEQDKNYVQQRLRQAVDIMFHK